MPIDRNFTGRGRSRPEWPWLMDERPQTTDTRPALRWLLSQARPVRLWIGLCAGTALPAALLLVLQARLIADIVDGAVMLRRTQAELRPLLGWLALAVGLRAVLHWAREAAGFQAGKRVRDRLRMAVLGHLAASGPLGAGAGPPGELASAAMEQVEALHGFYADYLPQLTVAVLVPVTLAAFVFPISWAAGGLLLLTAPLIPLFMAIIGMGAHSISQRHFQALARMSGHFLDTLQGLATLKLFGRSRGRAAAIAEVSDQYRRRTMQVLRVAFLSSAVLEFFSCVAIALVAIYLGLSFLGYMRFGTYGLPLSFADGLFILILAPDFYLPLRELGSHFHLRAEAVGASGQIRRLLSAPAMKQAGRPVPWPPQAPPAIRLENVHYRFGGGRSAALCGVELEIPAGGSLALVGASGAGKTTLGRLLLGFDQPTAGRIMVNGIDLASIHPESWRRHLSWVGQHPVLFRGTIRENIRTGDPRAPAAAVEEAARAAGVERFAGGLPQGLDTPVAEGGAGLSRGQAQQVALARAFLKNAPLLLLDEPTAGLDSAAEERIMEAVFAFCRGRSLVLMTHRLGRLQTVDHIAVLDAGSVVEQGPFRELADSGGMLSRFLQVRHEWGSGG